MNLSYLWPWNEVKVIKPGMNCYSLSKVYNHAKFENFPSTVSAKKPMLKFLLSQKTCNLSHLNKCKSKK